MPWRSRISRLTAIMWALACSPLPPVIVPAVREQLAALGDEGRGEAAVEEPARRLEVAHHEHVGQEVTHEPLVARLVLHEVREPAADRRVLGEDRERRDDAARQARHDRRAAAIAALEELEHLEARLHVVDDDVLQAIAERARERVREVLGALDAIGHEAEHALLGALLVRVAVARHHGAHATADALEAALDLLERPQARALLRDLGAELVDDLLAVGDLDAQILELGLELLLALGRGLLAAAQALEAHAELVDLLREIDDARFLLLAIAAEAVEARARVLAAALEALEHRLGAHDALLRLVHARAGLARHALGLGRRELSLLEHRDLARELVGLVALDLLELGERRGERVALLRQHRAALGEGRDLTLGEALALAQALEALLRGLEAPLEDLRVVVEVVRRALRPIDLGLRVRDEQALALELGLAHAQGRAVTVERALGDLELLVDHTARDRELEEAVRGDVQLEVLDLAAIGLVALGLLGLALERREVAIELGDDVADAQEVLPRLVHLPFGGLLLGLELRDARGLLDEVAAILGLGRDDEADAALLDDRVGLGADARAEEEVRHVHETNRGLVDEVLALARAIEAARDGDLGVVLVLRRREAIGVVEGQRHLGERVRTARLGAVEDDVVHGLAAEVLRGLLTHGPADGVDDVRLAAAVGTDDRRHVVVDVDDGLVHERLEPADLDLRDLHVT
jgi:hypothetical protein